MSRIDVKRPNPAAFVDVAVGRMALLQEPPKERPESVPSCHPMAARRPIRRLRQAPHKVLFRPLLGRYDRAPF